LIVHKELEYDINRLNGHDSEQKFYGDILHQVSILINCCYIIFPSDTKLLNQEIRN